MWKKWNMRRRPSCAATKVPLPCLRTSACCATRLSTAFRMVPIATPKTAASADSDGIASPARQRPAAIASVSRARTSS